MSSKSQPTPQPTSQPVKLPFYQHLFLSTSAASLAELVTLPIDTVKVNIQSNVTKINRQPHLHQNPVLSSIRNIYQHQGVSGFYRSWLSATTRQCLSSGSRLGFYSYFRDNLKLDQHPTHPRIGAVIQAATCGFLSSTVALPADVIKTRIQSSNEPISTLLAIKQVYTEPSSPRSNKNSKIHRALRFYRGFNQTALRAMTISSIQLPLYFGIQDYLKSNPHHNQFIQDLSLNQRTAISSIITTIGVTLAVYPIDLCKTQVQNNPNQSARALLSTILTTYRNPFLLYRGFSVGLIRSLPHFWLTTTIYENLKQLTSHPNNN